MKKILFRSFLFLITAIVLFSCKKDENAQASPSLDTFLKSKPNLTIFTAALEKAQLQSFITGPGPFTWFAPTDEAFQASLVTMDSLNRMTAGQANYFIQYHLVNALVRTVDMVAQNSFPRGSQLGATTAGNIYLGQLNDSFYVNGSTLVSPDNKVSSGVVHIINRLSIPPNLKGNIQTILNSTGQHSLFIAALTRGGRWAALGTTSAFTVFAPTDVAMTAAGYTAVSIGAATVGKMDSLVRYHLFSGTRIFTNDIGNVTTTGTFLGPTQTLKGSSNGRRIKGAGNANPFDITKPDILGTNGVVHIINGILQF